MLSIQVTLARILKLLELDKINRKIKIYKNHFWDFYNKQDIIVQKKIDWTINLVKVLKIVPTKFLSHMKNTDGLWEVRVKAVNGIYRIFCFFDDGNLVILLSGFQKKTQKTPKKEIKRAEKLKKEYYDNK